MAMKLAAGATFPSIQLERVGGTPFRLAEPEQDCDWRMVVVYRGRHCPRCAAYLTQLDALADRFRGIGVDPVAVSGDVRAKAEATVADLSLGLSVGYGLSVSQMHMLGLYVSDPRDAQETDQPFSEPGLFVINGDGAAQVIDIGNASFTRPDLENFLGGLSFTRQKGFPIRGTRTD